MVAANIVVIAIVVVVRIRILEAVEEHQVEEEGEEAVAEAAAAEVVAETKSFVTIMDPHQTNKTKNSNPLSEMKPTRRKILISRRPGLVSRSQ